MKNLTIDIGNSSVKYAVFEDGNMLFHDRISIQRLKEIRQKVNPHQPEQCIVCSTADITLQKSTICNLCNKVVLLDHNTPIPIRNLYKSPRTLGMDRLAAVVGAFCKVHGNALVIDMGTAITYDFINAEGEYLGGNISAGLDMRLHALNEHTARLPLIDVEGPHPSIGTTTDTAIRCGAIDGIRFEIEGYIRKFSLKYTNLSVFLTGGDLIYFDKEIKKRIFADDFLVMEGLNNIITYNRQQ